jgi:hypothetical protein
MGLRFKKGLFGQRPVIDDNAMKRLAKGRLPSRQPAQSLGLLPSEGEGHTFESCRVRHFGYRRFRDVKNDMRQNCDAEALIPQDLIMSHTKKKFRIGETRSAKLQNAYGRRD